MMAWRQQAREVPGTPWPPWDAPAEKRLSHDSHPICMPSLLTRLNRAIGGDGQRSAGAATSSAESSAAGAEPRRPSGASLASPSLVSLQSTQRSFRSLNHKFKSMRFGARDARPSTEGSRSSFMTSRESSDAAAPVETPASPSASSSPRPPAPPSPATKTDELHAPPPVMPLSVPWLAEPKRDADEDADALPTNASMTDVSSVPACSSHADTELPTSHSLFGSMRGLRLRAPPAIHRRMPPLDTARHETRRRSLFVPIRGHRSGESSPATRTWIEWRDTLGSPTRATRLRALRSSSVLSSSSSTQSLRTNASLTEEATPSQPALFGMRLRDAAAPLPHDLDQSDRPPLLSREQTRHFVVPRIVTRCIESLEKWGIYEEGLYRVPGRSSHAARLRALWELPGTDLAMAEINPADLDVHAVCSVFKMYLRELPAPIVPHETAAAMDQICAEESNDAVLATRLEPYIQSLPFYEWYLLRDITEHLGVLTLPKNVECTKMTLSNLALVLSPSLQISSTLTMTLVRCRPMLFHERARPTQPDKESPPPLLDKPQPAVDGALVAHAGIGPRAPQPSPVCEEAETKVQAARVDKKEEAPLPAHPSETDRDSLRDDDAEDALFLDPDAHENAEEWHPAELSQESVQTVQEAPARASADITSLPIAQRFSRPRSSLLSDASIL